MKSSTKWTLAALALAAALAAGVFVLRRVGPPASVRLAGRTVGADGSPLPGVRVILQISPGGTEEEMAVERVEEISDGSGNFSIRYQGRWRQASYRLEARKPGYRDVEIEGAENLRSPLTLRLVPGS